LLAVIQAAQLKMYWIWHSFIFGRPASIELQ